MFPTFVTDTHYKGIPRVGIAVTLMILLVGCIVFASPELIVNTFVWIFIFSPIWVPLTLLGYFWLTWVDYIRAMFIAAQKSILLEIKIPGHIYKTPRAMELLFTGMNVGPGETTEIDRWWIGKIRPWWSLELVSIEGRIHFYIWTWAQHREFIESQFYAQYPNIEIHEVEDYASGVTYDPNVNAVWGMEYILKKPDAYPIKTYIDFQLDQDAKKAEQIADPISGVFEKLSAMGKGEMFWLQILVRQNKGAPLRGHFWGDPKSWKDEANELIEELYEKSKPKNKDLVTGEITEGYPLLKPAEVNVIKALERSIEKSAYDVGIRGVYVTEKDSLKGYKISPFIVNLLSPFNSGYLNGFVPGNTWHVSMDYPWEDPFGWREEAFSRQILDAYRRRSFFHPPYKRPRFVLTTEELATIYHFPSEETRAPGIERIGSSKAEPPTNLPM